MACLTLKYKRSGWIMEKQLSSPRRQLMPTCVQFFTLSVHISHTYIFFGFSAAAFDEMQRLAWRQAKNVNRLTLTLRPHYSLAVTMHPLIRIVWPMTFGKDSNYETHAVWGSQAERWPTPKFGLERSGWDRKLNPDPTVLMPNGITLKGYSLLFFPLFMDSTTNTTGFLLRALKCKRK